MAARAKDPTEIMCKNAATFADVECGTSCTQSSFKVKKKAFFYVGPQGARFKAMFRLDDSMPEARRLAKAEPDRFEVGSTGWVTARFSSDEPMPAKIWRAWLKESYGLAAPGASASSKPTAQKSVKKSVKKSAKKSAKKTGKKTTRSKN